MLSFGHFRVRNHAYQPRTPAAALRAVTAGVGDIEELVYQGTSVKPLIEEPYELMELQRVLARSGLDLPTCLLLVRIFGRMLQDPDPERALFAAEGITSIEARWAARIEVLRKLEAAGDRETRRELGQRCYELGLLNEKTPVIRSFYLREAFVWLREHLAADSLDTGLLDTAVNILAQLGLHEQAQVLLSRAREPRSPDVLYLRARIAFELRRYDVVSVILRYLKTTYNRQSERIRLSIDQWTAE